MLNDYGKSNPENLNGQNISQNCCMTPNYFNVYLLKVYLLKVSSRWKLFNDEESKLNQRQC